MVSFQSLLLCILLVSSVLIICLFFFLNRKPVQHDREVEYCVCFYERQALADRYLTTLHKKFLMINLMENSNNNSLRVIDGNKDHEVMDAIENLQQMLNSHHQAAEKIMALRNPNLETLRSVTQSIDSVYEELVTNLEENDEIIAASFGETTIQNKKEFDVHKDSFFRKWTSTTDQTPGCSSNKPESVADTGSLSTRTSQSHASSRSSVKRREAEAEFRAAQIKARQAKERADERTILNKIAEREAQRKLEVAAAKLQVWDTDCDVDESQPIDSIITENRHETFHSDMISKDGEASHDNVQSSVRFKDPTPRPAIPDFSWPSLEKNREQRPTTSPKLFNNTMQNLGKPLLYDVNTAGKLGSDSTVQDNNDNVDAALNLNRHVLFCVACSVVPNVSLTHSWARGLSEWNLSHQYNFNLNDLRLTKQHSGLPGPCGSAIIISLLSQQSGLPGSCGSAIATSLPSQQSGLPGPCGSAIANSFPSQQSGLPGPCGSAIATSLPSQQSGLPGPCGSAIATSFPSQQSGLPRPCGSAIATSFPTQQSGLPGPCNLACDMGHSSQQQSYRPALSQYPVFPCLSDYCQPSYDELFLPRPEFKKFNGNPSEYKSFISNFETHVEPRV